MSRHNLWLTVVLSCAWASIAQATTFDLIEARDSSGEFVAGSNTVGTGATDGFVVLPTNLTGTSAQLSLAMVGSETAGTIGTEFTGTLTLDDGSPNPVLVVAINSIIVTNIGFGPSGSPATSIQFGGLDTSGQAEVTLLGGTSAAQFGGATMTGQMFIAINSLVGVPFFIPGNFFASSFTGDMNEIQVLFHTPEPNTASLVGLSLVAIAAWRRRGRAPR